MRNSSAKARRADLRRVRQDVLIQLHELEARTIPDAPPAPLVTLPIETIAERMLDAIGGGQLRVMRKGEQTIEQRAAELLEEEQRRLKRRW